MYQSFEKIGNKKDSGTTTSDDTISAVIKSKKGFAVSIFKDTNNESEKSNMIWECDDNYDTKNYIFIVKTFKKIQKLQYQWKLKSFIWSSYCSY